MSKTTNSQVTPWPGPKTPSSDWWWPEYYPGPPGVEFVLGVDRISRIAPRDWWDNTDGPYPYEITIHDLRNESLTLPIGRQTVQFTTTRLYEQEENVDFPFEEAVWPGDVIEIMDHYKPGLPQTAIIEEVDWDPADGPYCVVTARFTTRR